MVVSPDQQSEATCRICFEEADGASELIAPCGCSGQLSEQDLALANLEQISC